MERHSRIHTQAHAARRRLGQPPLGASPHLQRELELLQRLCDEQLVAERLARLHDADQRRVDLVLPVLKHLQRGRAGGIGGAGRG